MKSAIFRGFAMALSLSALARGADDYALGPDSMPQEDVPRGGRVNAILAKPQDAWLSNVAFGGPDLDILYVTCGDKVFKRKVKARGVLSYRAPIIPPRPRL